MQFSAVVFDLDGLLIDSERISAQAVRNTTAQFDLEPAMAEHLILTLTGRGDKDPNTNATHFGEAWRHHYDHLMETTPPSLLPGVADTLTWLNNKNVPTAVATSSSSVAAHKKLQTENIRPHFRTVTCGDEVENTKPNPEIYLKAAASMQLDPTQCLAMEDSENGVKAAIAAGFTVIQIPNLIPPSAELLAHGHTVCDSMHDALQWLKDQSS